MEMIQTLFVAVDEQPVRKTFNTIDDMILYFESETITTYESGIPGVGIVAGDQGDLNLPENILGINGDFMIVGMDRIGPSSQIRSLENHEIFGLKIGLQQTIEKKVDKLTITAIVKEIDTKSGRTRIITVSDLMNDHPGHEENIRITLEHFGTLKMGDVIYHPVKGESYVDLIGKSILFELKDFDDILMKVQGIKFGELVVGQDAEGMNVAIEINQIDAYYLPGIGGKYFEIL